MVQVYQIKVSSNRYSEKEEDTSHVFTCTPDRPEDVEFVKKIYEHLKNINEEVLRDNSMKGLQLRVETSVYISKNKV